MAGSMKKYNCICEGNDLLPILVWKILHLEGSIEIGILRWKFDAKGSSCDFNFREIGSFNARLKYEVIIRNQSTQKKPQPLSTIPRRLTSTRAFKSKDKRGKRWPRLIFYGTSTNRARISVGYTNDYLQHFVTTEHLPLYNSLLPLAQAHYS